jgi:hypothetical protein
MPKKENERRKHEADKDTRRKQFLEESLDM